MFNHLCLENFRNHKKFEIDLDQITVLVGLNGAGKSNILEAMTMLSFCRSFREDDKKNLINFDSDYARIVGDDLEIFLSKTPRLFMQAKEKGINRKLSDFIGCLPTVVFSSETISIITGSPSDRRRFLDVMISQINSEYLRTLIDYKKVKQQRNNLLQRIFQRQSGENELDFWDKELVKLGGVIVEERKKVINYINDFLSNLYQTISGDAGANLRIAYIKNFEADDLEEALHRFRRREIASGKTIFGPHRDDIIFELNGRNMANFASRGEIRSAVLALKIAELKYIENIKEESLEINNSLVKPILLLDDIFSEFDPERRAHLGELVSQYQSLITSTEESHLSPELLKKAKIIEITKSDG
ncbi:MAG: DNA replication and repair protein RecF [Patescibacteria group bacterium]|nr:DNA replication and repair protein RecF [Patescibacteria group bacterium]